jgi:hypothetical protein
MIAHTGYLIFARSVSIDHSMADRKLLKEIGMIGLGDEPDAQAPLDETEITASEE